MRALQETIFEESGKRIHLIPTNKFKTIHMIVKLKAPLNRDTITKRALLPNVLRQGTKNNPTRAQLEERLDDLYGAGLGIDGGKRGNEHVITFRFEIPNEKFIPNAGSMLDDAIALFKEVIYNPNVTNEAFDQDTFTREKETLKQKIKAIVDDKMNFAQMRLIDEMCSEELYSLHVYGYEEELDQLTSEDLYQYYVKALQEDEFDLYVLGDIDEAILKQKMTAAFSSEEREAVQINTQLENIKTTDLKEKIEYQDIQQAKLHIGYRTNCTAKDDQYAALLVFNGLFGGFPNSKLFMNVREKHSLAYYAASRVESHKGLLFVYSGIAPEDYDKAREIIELQFSDMKKGQFTEDELQETKDLLANDYLETLDHPQGIVELLYQQVLTNKERTPEQLIHEVRNVSKEAVIQIANQISEDTIYLLTTNGGGASNETSQL